MAGPTVVVAGAGQAGSQAAASLREAGFGGRIVLVGDETHPPYQRPPLSKGHITGTVARDNLWLRPQDFYADKDIEVLLDERVSAIDRERGSVVLRSGGTLDFDHLVLALGARNRPLPVEGVDLDGVVGLRTLAHADDIRDRMERACRVVVIGGGFIGLEIAATAVRLGRETVVVEIAEQLMGRVLSGPTAEYLRDAHRDRGMRIELGTAVTRIDGVDGRVTGVTTADGRTFPADLVLVGVGAVPNVELAVEAGLLVDNGIVVDEYLSTEDPRISAVGDCATCPNPFAGGRTVRLESVQNATAQARSIAARHRERAAVPRRAVVLERPGGHQGADRRAGRPWRPHGRAWRAGLGEVLGLLLRRGYASRGRVRQPAGGAHGRATVDRFRGPHHAGAGGGSGLRPPRHRHRTGRLSAALTPRGRRLRNTAPLPRHRLGRHNTAREALPPGRCRSCWASAEVSRPRSRCRGR
jgi:3-phenylpropionate/trans-cinnamate dioxygenase ferredoxin reductase subunit